MPPTQNSLTRDQALQNVIGAANMLQGNAQTHDVLRQSITLVIMEFQRLQKIDEARAEAAKAAGARKPKAVTEQQTSNEPATGPSEAPDQGKAA
jgi:hypothetical protein